MSVIPFSGTVGTYTNVFQQLGDGKFDLGDITAPVGAAMDVMGWLCDPCGALAGAALGPLLDWLSNNFVVLKWPLDRLAGDQGAITSKAEEWIAVTEALVTAGNEHAATAGDLPSWSQAGAAEYHQLQKDINLAFQAAATQSANVARGIQTAGQVCAGVRAAIWDIVKGFVTSAVGNALAALATSVITCGGSIGAFTAWFMGKFAWVQGKILGWLSKLSAWASKVTQRWTKLSEYFAKSAEALKKMSKHKYSQSGGYSSAASKRSGGKVKVKEVEKPQFVPDAVKDPYSKVSKPIKKVNGPLNAADKAGDKQKDVPSPSINTIP